MNENASAKATRAAGRRVQIREHVEQALRLAEQEVASNEEPSKTAQEVLRRLYPLRAAAQRLGEEGTEAAGQPGNEGGADTRGPQS